MLLDIPQGIPPHDSLHHKTAQHITLAKAQCARILDDTTTYQLTPRDLSIASEDNDRERNYTVTLFPWDRETVCLAQYTCCLWLDAKGALLLQMKGVPGSFTLNSVSTDWSAIDRPVRLFFGGNQELQQFTNGGYPMNDFLFSSIRIDLVNKRALVEFTDQWFPPFEVPLYILEQLVLAIKSPTKQAYIDLNHSDMQWLIAWFKDAELPEGEYEDYQSLSTRVDYVKIALRQVAP
jgi:hypothetical protein